MAEHRSLRRFLAPLTSIVVAMGLAGCAGDKAAPTPATTSVADIGQPTEAPTAVIDPAPVVTDPS